jgi:hypothetical protein
MLEVCDEYSRLDYSERERSYSLPIPDIQVLQKNSTITPTFQKFLELKRQRKADKLEKSKNKAVNKSQTLPTISSGKEIFSVECNVTPNKYRLLPNVNKTDILIQQHQNS